MIVLYLVINCDDPVAIFDSLDKAKEFCLKQEYPSFYSISSMEVNKEHYTEIYYWDYKPSTKEWKESSEKNFGGLI